MNLLLKTCDLLLLQTFSQVICMRVGCESPGVRHEVNLIKPNFIPKSLILSSKSPPQTLHSPLSCVKFSTGAQNPSTSSIFLIQEKKIKNNKKKRKKLIRNKNKRKKERIKKNPSCSYIYCQRHHQ